MANSSSSGGIGVTGLLFVAFVVLKLTHAIDWSWWWVTSPIWGSLLLFFAGAGLFFYFDARKERRLKKMRNKIFEQDAQRARRT